jgi:hypothetical protein
MMIKNLIPSLAENRKVKIGIKGEKRKSKGGGDWQLPQKIDHFRITTMQKGTDGNFILDKELHDLYGDEPRRIPIRLLFDDINLNYQSRYAQYNGMKLACYGDGETCHRNNQELHGKCPCEKQNPTYPGKDKCKINSILSFVIDGSETVGGCCKFRTTSYNSTVGIISSLTLIASTTGGILAGLPLDLTLTEKQAANPKDGTQNTIYVVGLEYRGNFEQLRNEGYQLALDREKHNIKIKDIEHHAQKLLANSAEMMGPDDELTQEFYPEEAFKEETKKRSFGEMVEEKKEISEDAERYKNRLLAATNKGVKYTSDCLDKTPDNIKGELGKEFIDDLLNRAETSQDKQTFEQLQASDMDNLYDAIEALGMSNLPTDEETKSKVVDKYYEMKGDK